MTTTNTNIERGLKSEISRQVGIKNYQAEVAQFNQNCLVNAWYMSYAIGGVRDELEEQIWEYVELTMGQIWWYGKSNRMGLLTSIDDYVSKTKHKADKTIKAHYTANKKYYGSVKTYGTNPVSYDGHFRITRGQFNIDISLLPTICKGLKEPCEFIKLFTPKPELFVPVPSERRVLIVVESFDSDDEPIGEKMKRQHYNKTKYKMNTAIIPQYYTDPSNHPSALPNTCPMCFLLECACKADQLQVLADDKRFIESGLKQDSDDEPIGEKMKRQNAIRK